MSKSITRLFGLSERSGQEEVRQIRVDEIVPSPYQPRSVFDEERIEELCRTIRTHGVIQPIIVREKNGKYELIAGERRWRAVRRLGLEHIPAIVRNLNDSQAASVSLIENLQREELTAIEEAMAYQQLIQLHGLTQESLAQRLGKSQSTIANKIRLLQLGEPVRQALLERKISERHARALLALPNEELQNKVLGEILEKDLTVKQTEDRVSLQLQVLEADGEKRKDRRRVSFAKDVRLAINTIRQSLDMVTSAGLRVKSEEHDRGDHYEIIIRIPKR